MSLLSLPWEIRNMILSSLLILPVPIKSHHNIRWLDTSQPPHSGASQPGWDLWTPSQRPTGQILRTCRLLHDEGLEMLYRHNTFSILLLIGVNLDEHTAIRFLNHTSLATAFTHYPALRLATKFAVDIHFDPTVIHFIWSRPFDPASALVAQMRRHLPPRLDELALHFRWADAELDARVHLPKYMFYHLRFLRTESFAITGMLDDKAELFTRVIGSRLPTVDLEDEYRRLGNMCRKMEVIRRWMNYQNALWTAVCEFDLDGFQRMKELVLAGSGGNESVREQVTDA